MKRLVCLLLAAALLLCGCGAAEQVSAVEPARPANAGSAESAAEERADTRQPEMEPAPAEAGESDAQGIRKTKEFGPPPGVDSDSEASRAEFLRLLLEAYPDLEEDASFWAELDEAYDEYVTKGEVVEGRSFTYREPLYYARETHGSLNVRYYDIFADDYAFELEFGPRAEVLPMLQQVVESGDETLLLEDAREMGEDVEGWTFHFFARGAVKGMEVQTAPDNIAVIAFNEQDCVMLEEEDLDPETMQAIRDLFASLS